MTTESILLSIIVILIFLLFKDFLFSNLHITRTIVHQDFDTVWNHFSEPENYAKLFPNWIVSISKKDTNTYEAVEKHVKEPAKITIEKNKEFGFIKLTIGQEETSQIRLVPLDENKTLALNIGYRWKGFPYPFWLNFKRSTEADYKNAKHIIEQNQRSDENKTRLRL